MGTEKGLDMSVWFITGASRGFGLEITREALCRGDSVVATARNPQAVQDAIPDGGDRLLAVGLDVGMSEQVTTAVQASDRAVRPYRCAGQQRRSGPGRHGRGNLRR